MNFEDLSPELQEKVKACQSGEELAKLAQEEGYELTDEQLEAVSGGVDWKKVNCPSNDCEEHNPCTLLY